MAPPTLIPVSPSGERHSSSKRASSVPSSPTSKNPALRSTSASGSKGGFLPPGATSPRRAGSCSTCVSCKVGSAADKEKDKDKLPLLPTSQYSPTQKAGSPRASLFFLEYFSGLFSRPVLWIMILLFSNYMGYFHPFLWSPRDRAAIVAMLTGPLKGQQPGDRPGKRDEGVKMHPPTSLVASSDLPLTFPKGFNLELPDSAPALALDGIETEQEALTPSTASATGAEAGASAFTHGQDQLGMSAEAMLQESKEEMAPAGVFSEGEEPTIPKSKQAEVEKAGQQLAQGLSNPYASTSSTGSPYVGAWTINLGVQRSCRKIFPRHLVKSSQGPIAFVGDLLRKRQRLLLTIPRHGLGNSLRGYVSSFVYAALSGRRLVRFHGAEHAKVFDTLCHSFQCGFEAIEGSHAPGGAMGLFKQLDHLNPVDLNSKFKVSAQVLTSLRCTWTLFVTKSPHFFDGFWHNFPPVRQCIYDAFGCSSAWCVRSRAMQALVGPPTPLLEDVIHKILKQHVGPGQADILAHRDVNDMFDLTLHFRTRPAAIEAKHPGAAEKGQAGMKIGCGGKDSGSQSQYLQSCLWDCLGGIIKKLANKRVTKGRPMQILLATDNEELRPEFVDRLSKFGTVYYSSGVIVHSSKSASDEAERLPTMAEFHLMSRSHTILEAGSYISTFAYFSGLLGNGTLAGIDWPKKGRCGLKFVHKGELFRGA